ncbi:hypothetical protein [Cytophaga hutchinsonii]|uniref:Lipoprotein n=1 Tax=Cytophaga hutchinsonii (strain ATCC 33406 / DSM 1761 / CIP 103989 / NBRC 15051 / NCIMB 9469 / D465) TaxID=269798 RepID=A0A6N4SSB0_CYTH3|nr:hypothetical protein [Cytophaga hutchinsonii]ABG59201.1 hypothetical protein CHU_1935 [Cytophaga hutchinsonii ATCC 33406]SFX34382.1 hypothetical protein SAMN04487930_103103 [Cytophaga hutchinsonii ATCC 33406]
MNKKFFSFAIILTIVFATLSTSCRKGEKGEPGPAGSSSTTPAYKGGSISGTIDGVTRLNDSSFSLKVDYQYYKSASDNRNTEENFDGTRNVYSVTRYDSTGNSYITFEFSVYYYDPNSFKTGSTSRSAELVPELSDVYVTIVSNKKQTGNKLFYFATVSDYYNPFDVESVYLDQYSSGDSRISYDNLVINEATGLISFDYDIELSEDRNSTGNFITMSGKLNATPYNVSYRKGTAE